MDIKDLTYTASGPTGASKQRSLKALPRVVPASVQNGEVAVTTELETPNISKSEAALKQTDALVADISDQAKSIGSYVKSLNGILDQGVKESSEVRRAALSKEANQVLQAIKEKVVSLKVGKPTNITGDPIRSEVEAKIGKTLELLFPDHDDGGGSFPEISFSNKDLIISVQTKILKASNYLDSLREADLKKNVEVKAILDKAETAQINAESAQTSIRDVDSAFKLADEASSLISVDSKTALYAIGAVREPVDVQG
jgi:hypothetical protein